MSERRSGDLTNTLVAELRDMIARGALHPGGKLPPERELAYQFSVNRASVRQALKALEVMGIVRQRVGDGTYLTEDASTTLSAPLDFLLLVDGITFAELFEARRIVEPELAARAAARRTPEELDELEMSLAIMKSDFDAGELQKAAEVDQRFHQIIWHAAGNRVCQRMFEPLHKIMTGSFAVTSTIPEYAAAAASHQSIVDAIRVQDGEAARTAMLNHLLASEAQLVHAAMAPAID